MTTNPLLKKLREFMDGAGPGDTLTITKAYLQTSTSEHVRELRQAVQILENEDLVNVKGLPTSGFRLTRIKGAGNQDQRTLSLAQACYEIASTIQSGGRAQAVSKIQVILNQMLDAASLSSHPSNATGTAAAIAGYTKQTDAKVALVNEFKQDEERLLRKLDAVAEEGRSTDVEHKGTVVGKTVLPVHDPRWLAIARTHLQEGFMALNRAVFQPQRIKLPEDD